MIADGGAQLTRTQTRHQVEEERTAIGRFLAGWYQEAGIGPRLEWRNGAAPVLGWRGDGLFAGLVVALTTAISRPTSLTRPCACCGEPVVPFRTTDSRSWCDSCKQTGEDKRAASRDFRARQALGVVPSPGRGRPRR